MKITLDPIVLLLPAFCALFTLSEAASASPEQISVIAEVYEDVQTRGVDAYLSYMSANQIATPLGLVIYLNSVLNNYKDESQVSEYLATATDIPTDQITSFANNFPWLQDDLQQLSQSSSSASETGSSSTTKNEAAISTPSSMAKFLPILLGLILLCQSALFW